MRACAQDPIMHSPRRALPGQAAVRRTSRSEPFILLSPRRMKRSSRNCFFQLIARLLSKLPRRLRWNYYAENCWTVHPVIPSEVEEPRSTAAGLAAGCLDFARHDNWLVVTNVYRRANLGAVVKQFCPIDGFADAAVRGGVARQNSDVHPDAFAGEPKEPFHGRTGKVRSARRGLAACTNSGTYCAAGTVHEIAVKTGMMIGVLFHHIEVSSRCLVPASARRDWTIGHDLVPNHKVSPLLWDRDDNARIVLRCLFQ